MLENHPFLQVRTCIVLLFFCSGHKKRNASCGFFVSWVGYALAMLSGEQERRRA